MTLSIVPVKLGEVRKWIALHHSHLGPPSRYMLACGVSDGARTVCVVVGEWPQGPGFNKAGGTVLEISRVASDGSTEHAASKGIAAMCRAAIALGYTRIVSYTLLGEAGTSYRAAGWHATALVNGRERSCKSAPRLPSEQPLAKVRWEFGPAAAPANESIAALVRESIGTVTFRPREDREPLLRMMRRST